MCQPLLDWIVLYLKSNIYLKIFKSFKCLKGLILKLFFLLYHVTYEHLLEFGQLIFSVFEQFNANHSLFYDLKLHILLSYCQFIDSISLKIILKTCIMCNVSLCWENQKIPFSLLVSLVGLKLIWADLGHVWSARSSFYHHLLNVEFILVISIFCKIDLRGFPRNAQFTLYSFFGKLSHVHGYGIKQPTRQRIEKGWLFRGIVLGASTKKKCATRILSLSTSFVFTNVGLLF